MSIAFWHNIIITCINHPIKKIAPTIHLNDLTIFLIACNITIYIAIGIAIYIPIAIYRNNKKKDKDQNKDKFIISKKIFSKIKYALIVFPITVIVLEICKLMKYQNYGFIQSLNHIKTLGYMLGGILAILGLGLSYKRLKALETQINDTKIQHDQTLKENNINHKKNLQEQKFKNAVELLSEKKRTSRLLGVDSLVELTLDNPDLKFLEPNIEVLMLHLEDTYNREIQDLSESYDKNIIYDGPQSNEGRNQYIADNHTHTSEEIILTLKHIIKLTNHIKIDTPANKLYDLNIPLTNVPINSNGLIFKNIRFIQKVNGVTFEDILDNVSFYNELNTVIFHKLNNVKFNRNLTGVAFYDDINDLKFNFKPSLINVKCHESVITNLITQYVTDILSNKNMTISIYIDNSEDLITIIDNCTSALSTTVEIIIDQKMLTYSTTLSYNIVSNEVLEYSKEPFGCHNDTTQKRSYTKDQISKDIKEKSQDISNATRYWKKYTPQKTDDIHDELFSRDYISIGCSKDFKNIDPTKEDIKKIYSDYERYKKLEIDNFIKIKKDDIIIIASNQHKDKIQICKVITTAKGINKMLANNEYTNDDVGLILKVKNLTKKEWIDNNIDPTLLTWNEKRRTISNIDKLSDKIQELI